MPKLDGVTFKILAAQDGRGGNTAAQKTALPAVGFHWNSQLKSGGNVRMLHELISNTRGITNAEQRKLSFGLLESINGAEPSFRNLWESLVQIH